MKKMIAIMMVLALCLAMLAGCGDKAASSTAAVAAESVASVIAPVEPAVTEAPVVSEEPVVPEAPEAEPASAEEAASAVEEEPAVGMPNPMTEVEADELDIPLTAPKDATDVHYYTLKDEKGDICQMDFTLEDIEYCYRAQPSGEKYAYDISGMYYTGWTAAPAKVQNCDGTVMTCDEASVVYWLDTVPGINYALATANAIPADDITKLAGEIFVSVQGDADAELEEDQKSEDDEDKDDEETDDDTVVYTDEDENTVKLIDEGDDIYSVGVSIVGLSHMRGTAYAMDGGYEIIVLDPNDNELRAYFTADDDDTYTLEIISSDWDLLEEDTTFTGFTKDSKTDSKTDSKSDSKTDSKTDAEDEAEDEAEAETADE